MTNLRRVLVALVLLGITLAIPVGVLVVRALETAAVEQENRHRLLAERVFDEMEESLSRFLEAEEARPFDAYRGFDGARLSPLAEASPLPFVIGHFQIDPDGSLHTPRAPSPEVAQLEGSLRSAWEETVDAPQEVLVPATMAARDRLGGAIGAAAQATGPSATEGLQKKAQEQKVESKDAGEETPKQDSYEVYRRLNRAQERRAERKQKVTIQRAAPPSPSILPGAPKRLAPEPELAEMDSLEDREPDGGRSIAPLPQADVPRARPAPAASPPSAKRSAIVRIALDPMIGRPVSGDRLLLYRTVLVGEQGYRQGLLVDWRKLGAWLEGEVIVPSGLAAKAVDFGRDPSAATGQYVYRHRFAEPFNALHTRLALAPLPGGDGTNTIYALTALLAFVAAVGGIAVYRMVSVVVRFAERRSRFAASVSHELKTPLTSIRMYGEMLRDGLVPSESKRAEYYHTITDESERLSRLIDNVLDFSRLEKGEYEIDRRRGEVLPVLREAIGKLAPHVERQGFELHLEAAEPIPEVELDRDALTQVIFNLVDNAVKYARGAANKQITVSCRGVAGAVQIDVRDHGPGVPEQDLAQIFEPFFRRDDELTRTTKGTGIGLALVKELVESLGGRVVGSNAEGRGLLVRVTLPAV